MAALFPDSNTCTRTPGYGDPEKDLEEQGLTLRNLSNELANVVTKYFEIGIQLGIPEHQLNKFESDHHSAQRRFSKVISYWLDNATRTVSWDSLIIALKTQSVDEKKLANELAKKYHVPSLSAKALRTTPESCSHNIPETTGPEVNSNAMHRRSDCVDLLGHTTVSKEVQESYGGVVRELHDKLHINKTSGLDSTCCIAEQWSIDDLHHVLNMTWDAREKWYCIGLGLGINSEDLDHIKDNNNGNVDECFIGALKTWLTRGENTDPKHLSIALRQQPVNFTKLADTINVVEHEVQMTKAAQSPIQLESTADNRELFPHFCFDSLGLNAHEITKLKVQLLDDAEMMETDFSRFVVNIIMSFKRRGLLPQELATYVTQMNSVFYDDSATDTIMNADSIDKIMIELRRRKYVTIFNYHLLENIIKDLGTDSEKESFKSYFHSFKEYCKRSLFEVPQFLYDKVSTDRIKFALKISDEFKGYFQSTRASNSLDDTTISQDVKISSKTLGLSVNDTIDILRKFAKILDRDVGSFCIVDAKQGCTKIVLSVLKSVAGNIKVLLKMDTNQGIKELKSSGICVGCGPPGKPRAVDTTDSSITLTWTKPAFDIGGISNYIIFYRPANGSAKEWHSAKTSGQEETISICNLAQIGSSFIFKVCAFGDFEEGVESEESEEITLEDCAKTTPVHCTMRMHLHDIALSSHVEYNFSPRDGLITQGQRRVLRDTSMCTKDQVRDAIVPQKPKLRKTSGTGGPTYTDINKKTDTPQESLGGNPVFKPDINYDPRVSQTQGYREYIHIQQMSTTETKFRKTWKKVWAEMILTPVSPMHNFIAFYKSEEEWKWNHNPGDKMSLETEFHVKKLPGKHTLQIILPLYQISLAFDSVTKRNEWYQALTKILCCYHVDLARCREFPYIEGEYVVEVCPSASFMVWPVKKDKLGWEWKFSDIEHFSWHPYATKLEVIIRRSSKVGTGQFFFTGRHAHRLYITMKNMHVKMRI